MKYLHFYDTEAKYEAVRNGEGYVEPWVSYTEENTEVNYNKSEYEKLLGTPLTFEITGDGDIIWKANNTALTKTIEYSKNDGEWTEITSTAGKGTTISVASGDTVQFRGNNARYGSSDTVYNTFSGTTAQFKAKGNIMSLINSTDFSTLSTLQDAYAFNYLFRGCTGLTDASKLLLPATRLTLDCYRSMLRDCTSLIATPELPATILSDNCYRNMFQGCTSLTTAPELPATVLNDWCYSAMFRGCTSLTTAPELPATTLTPNCYKEMFYQCSSLLYAPELPATTLADSCYTNMFNGCTNLNYIKCLATDISATSCTTSWVYGVQSSSGTFVKATGVNWSEGTSGVPTGWTVVDA